MAESEWDGQEPMPALTDDERAEYEQRAQELTDLTQELGLYDDPFEPDFGPDVLANPVCPFCGKAQPCPSHRAGG